MKDIDNGDDLEDNTNDFDLNPEKDRELSLEFNIPLEVEDDEYDLIVEIKGENERSFPYFKKIEFEVEVDKEKHDIIFNNLEFENNNIQCGGSANIKVNVVNLGTENDVVRLVISNQELDINVRESFELSEDPYDKDNSFSKTYDIKLPAYINPDIYIFRADLFYGSNIESSTAELNVECNKFIQTKLKLSNTGPNTDTESKITGAITTTNIEEKNLSSRNILIVSLISGEIIVLILGATLLVYVLRK